MRATPWAGWRVRIVAATLAAAVTAAYAEPAADGELPLQPMPAADLFQPLMADPKQPRFMVSWLRVRSDDRDTDVAAVALGENFGILRRPSAGGGWQLNLSAAVLAQFDVNAPSDDLMNADYIVGFPLSWRSGHWSSRLRVYHQSSHLGDEYILRLHPDRVALSFESLEYIVSYDTGVWRYYGGGEYIFHRSPDDLKPALAHAGFEYRGSTPLFLIGDVGAARWVGAIDVRSWEQHDWSAGWSAKTGLEFRPAHGNTDTGRYWNLLLELYDGPSPYGQFYVYDISYLGVSLVLHL